MRSFFSAALFLSTLVFSVSAATRTFTFKIEREDISPDGQQHRYQAQDPTLINHLGFTRSALVINGQTPGPELHLVQGDAVEESRPKAYSPVNAHHNYRSQS